MCYQQCENLISNCNSCICRRIMGSVCLKEQTSQHPSEKGLSGYQLAQMITDHCVKFILEEKVARDVRKAAGQGRCMFVFVEQFNKSGEHSIFLKFGPNIGRRVQQFVDAKLYQEKWNRERSIAGPSEKDSYITLCKEACPEQSILIPVTIENLPFQYICVQKIDIWAGQDHYQQNYLKLEKKLVATLKKLVNSNIADLYITELNQQFGVPLQVAQQVLSRALSNTQDTFNSVKVICHNDLSQDNHEITLNRVMRKNHDKTASNTSLLNSNYERVKDRAGSSLYF